MLATGRDAVGLALLPTGIRGQDDIAADRLAG